MKHSTTDVSFLALHISVIHTVVAAIPVPSAFLVLLVALIIRFFTGGAPKKAALIRVRPAGAPIAKGRSHFAGDPVHFVHVPGTEFILSVAIFRQIALVFGHPA